MTKAKKLCPFCKGEGIVDQTDSNVQPPQYFVRCRSCGAEGGWAYTTSGALQNWDMRDGQRDSDPPIRTAPLDLASHLQPGVSVQDALALVRQYMTDLPDDPEPVVETTISAEGVSDENIEIKKVQFGVQILKRGPDDPHAVLQLLSEDDDNWLESGTAFSGFWLDDLIAVLTEAKSVLQSVVFQPDKYGYKWRKQ